LLTLFSMIKIWNEVFWKEQKAEFAAEQQALRQLPKFKIAMMFVPIILLAAITLFIGLNPEPFLDYANEAAQQLLNPSIYINAVLGGAQ